MSLTGQSWDASCGGRRHDQKEGGRDAGGCLTLRMIDSAPPRLPVLVQNAVLHWEQSMERLVVVAGFMRLHRVRIEPAARGKAAGMNQSRGRAGVAWNFVECVGSFHLATGGILELGTCLVTS